MTTFDSSPCINHNLVQPGSDAVLGSQVMIIVFSGHCILSRCLNHTQFVSRHLGTDALQHGSGTKSFTDTDAFVTLGEIDIYGPAT